MQTQFVQRWLAYAALMLLPWPCFRPFETSITFGDLCLIAAALLNFDRALRLHAFQIPLLLSFPMVLVSQVLDADASMIEPLQAVYVFGFVLPFGWVAFAKIPVQRVVSIFLSAQAISSAFAIGQTLGYVDIIGKQRVWETLEVNRAAGLNMSCSSLCMSLTPLLCFVPYLKNYRSRLTVMLLLVLGLAATLAKSTVFAFPALAYCLVKEPNRKRVFAAMAAMIIVGGIVLVSMPALQTRVVAIGDSLLYRFDRADFSMWERTSTMRFAAGLISECYLFGLGYTGTSTYVSMHLGNTVHIYHLGLILVGGLVAAVLHYWGLILICRQAIAHGEFPVVMAMLTHWLSVCTMTVLMHSFQYLPYILCAVVVNASIMSAEDQTRRFRRQRGQQSTRSAPRQTAACRAA